MAIHKKEEFTSTDQMISMVAKAMSHPARIAILRIVSENPNCTTGDIVELLPLAQATVSHHLKEMAAAGLIIASNEGKKSIYQVNWPSWKLYTSLFGGLADNIREK
ncbi:ArsR/SmtB family transcription factor [Mucilaginibacter celer]|uniref:ArsR family transcriptional regulator n=1 Tax=Mucilaginibacter celer TaxID=2305508 RepID=A0A494VRP5_9SPHI|nr:metalloregulator ArsR/SmtB family transcription factor [Mucilaginibacter celer]AYL98296.1 ArsR family transcriptional regulator [Mucilaginibacter celer]